MAAPSAATDAAYAARGRATHRAMRVRHRWRLTVAAMAAATAVVTAWGAWSAPVVSYYAAAALSMSRSWTNFLFGAVDPAGTITVDKIPGGLWPAALAVRLFGYSPAAVILPNAVAAAAAVVVIAVTARRLAGPAAGVVAGAAMATTPVLVAVSRSNQPESLFVLAMACAAWAAVHALQRRSLGWLLMAGVFIAAGFQVYMLLAWAAWPALAAAYACTRQPWRRRIVHVAVAGLVSAALSLVWVIAVWLMPVGTRPYLGSTLHDSPWELVFGYNGLGRFGATADPGAFRSFAPVFTGPPAVLRLVSADLAGQIAWLLPATATALVLLVVLRAPVWLPIMLGGWALTLCVALSAVSGMHEFYTAVLAVPMSLAVAAAFGRADRARAGWAAPTLVVVCALTALGIAVRYSPASVPIAVGQLVIAAVAVVLLLSGHRPGRRGIGRYGVAAVTAAVAGMLLVPAVWSVTTMAGIAAGDPVAGGPLAATGPARAAASVSSPSGVVGGALSTPGDGGALMRYVDAHAGAARYRIAVFGAQQAAALIVRSRGASVLPVGGYGDADPVPTLEAFTAMVQAGDVRFVQVPPAGPGITAGTQAARIRSWVTTDCRLDASAPVADVYACTRR